MALVKFWILISLSTIFIVSGCKQKNKTNTVSQSTSQKEILVYCENSMLGIVLNLKEQFEKEYDCNVRIQNDCAQNLMDLISYTGKGDLYIPSSTASFKEFQHKTGQILMDSVFIGYNTLVFMVKKGNPKKFDGRFSSLLQDKYSMIIADPETSSVGYETKKLLMQNNVYKRVLPKIVSLTSDSKGLSKGLKNNQADVVIDWHSNFFANGNRNYVEVIRPDLQNNRHIPIFAASLSCSSKPTLTKAFLDFTSSQLNESRLSKYGFTRRKTIIF
ncbi:substrate-binding domain-containing protein [Carboxylicivirga linearis]|uniref:Substrate-binding domain-containing protein n=1 Tax=Carboxylicivirga linearis TaxID=1628157 RepID=A0ABS5JV25_9BACT|nr:substrate-binding domain-containing protein [Carboxylicivirga linearis]MBS2098326.1 substrate-binding domain-containing protein [Carboxylicivirga linearis]